MKRIIKETAMQFDRMFVGTGILNLFCAAISYFIAIKYAQIESIVLNTVTFMANYIIGFILLIRFIRGGKND